MATETLTISGDPDLLRSLGFRAPTFAEQQSIIAQQALEIAELNKRLQAAALPVFLKGEHYIDAEGGKWFCPVDGRATPEGTSILWGVSSVSTATRAAASRSGFKAPDLLNCWLPFTRVEGAPVVERLDRLEAEIAQLKSDTLTREDLGAMWARLLPSYKPGQTR